jgi:hypothetical protein
MNALLSTGDSRSAALPRSAAETSGLPVKLPAKKHTVYCLQANCTSDKAEVIAHTVTHHINCAFHGGDVGGVYVWSPTVAGIGVFEIESPRCPGVNSGA